MLISDVAKFRNAVSKDYCLEMFYDSLSTWRFVVKVDKDRVIEISVHHECTHNAKWKETKTTFEKRMEKYSHPLHSLIVWRFIGSSYTRVSILLLTGFLATILMQMLKNDFVKHVWIQADVLPWLYGLHLLSFFWMLGMVGFHAVLLFASHL
ncbi:transmembrane 9 superfamily member 2-like isoform X2 [Zingiber officinale]|uniref:transmembrane 9 superfamily member 2-like isoform X2 n=1 Tax=Zingiber officinale TaxID=94328 RepID=UPI001C4B30CF|nr:transmembrane 9 superfamily member 2-like isoform X2 [Zingiber officinale]